ncbi:serine/threonine-protein kinase [Desertimonas flava]|uniref:serine/threonine-protein kinase n=1 Tax=Desertimonas flava TaxID=2064846 RepID=UPI000E341DFE|nr:serine/threonine-protein kinase [Desertimonas flava]
MTPEDRYRLLHLVGYGGTAFVWKAVDTETGGTVAVKWARLDFDEEHARRRFEAEAAVLGDINHPNVPKVFETFDRRGRPAMSMECIEGRLLASIVESPGALDVPAVAGIGSDVARALEATHHTGRLHLSVKPGNIMVTEHGRAVLLDFNQSSPIGEVADNPDEGLFCDFWEVAPERVEFEPLEEPADVYSLGCTLFEALTGGPPFQDRKVYDLLIERLWRDPPDLSEIRPDLPAGLVSLVHRTLDRKPECRPTLGEIVDILQPLAASDGQACEPVTSAEIPRATAPINVT